MYLQFLSTSPLRLNENANSLNTAVNFLQYVQMSGLYLWREVAPLTKRRSSSRKALLRKLNSRDSPTHELSKFRSWRNMEHHGRNLPAKIKKTKLCNKNNCFTLYTFLLPVRIRTTRKKWLVFFVSVRFNLGLILSSYTSTVRLILKLTVFYNPVNNKTVLSYT
jgi:hypothetical protein